MSERIQVPACDRCSVGVMDMDNPHRLGTCECECHAPRAAPPAQEEAPPTLGPPWVWTLDSVLERLADAASHLLRDHDCDGHGHEGVRYAEQAAREHLARLRAAQEEAPAALPREVEEALERLILKWRMLAGVQEGPLPWRLKDPSARVAYRDCASALRAALDRSRGSSRGP